MKHLLNNTESSFATKGDKTEWALLVVFMLFFAGYDIVNSDPINGIDEVSVFWIRVWVHICLFFILGSGLLTIQRLGRVKILNTFIFVVGHLVNIFFIMSVMLDEIRKPTFFLPIAIACLILIVFLVTKKVRGEL